MSATLANDLLIFIKLTYTHTHTPASAKNPLASSWLSPWCKYMGWKSFWWPHYSKSFLAYIILIWTSIVLNTRGACTLPVSLSKPHCPKGTHGVCGNCHELALKIVFLVLWSHTRQRSQLKLRYLLLLANVSPVQRSLGFPMESVHTGLSGVMV